MNKLMDLKGFHDTGRYLLTGGVDRTINMVTLQAYTSNM